MNKQRRKQISDIRDRLADLIIDLEAVRDAEQEYYDAMPESIQGGAKGARAQEDIDSLDAAAVDVQNASEQLMGME